MNLDRSFEQVILEMVKDKTKPIWHRRSKAEIVRLALEAYFEAHGIPIPSE